MKMLLLVTLYAVACVASFVIAIHCFASDDAVWGIGNIVAGVFWLVLLIRRLLR